MGPCYLSEDTGNFARGGGSRPRILGVERPRSPDDDADPPAGLTVAQVARIMRVSSMSVYRLIRSGSLNAQRVGNRYLVQEADVHAYLSESYFRVV
jgi:excisionase family DNA binding protein